MTGWLEKWFWGKEGGDIPMIRATLPPPTSTMHTERSEYACGCAFVSCSCEYACARACAYMLENLHACVFLPTHPCNTTTARLERSALSAAKVVI